MSVRLKNERKWVIRATTIHLLITSFSELNSSCGWRRKVTMEKRALHVMRPQKIFNSTLLVAINWVFFHSDSARVSRDEIHLYWPTFTRERFDFYSRNLRWRCKRRQRFCLQFRVRWKISTNIEIHSTLALDCSGSKLIWLGINLAQDSGSGLWLWRESFYKR